MPSEYFKHFLKKSTCSDCGKILKKGIVIDWLQRLPWCADCFLGLLADQRSSEKEGS